MKKQKLKQLIKENRAEIAMSLIAGGIFAAGMGYSYCCGFRDGKEKAFNIAGEVNDRLITTGRMQLLIPEKGVIDRFDDGMFAEWIAGSLLELKH